MPELIDVTPGSPEWHAARRQEAGVIECDGEIVGYRRIRHVKEHTRKAGTRDMIVRANSKETSSDD